MKRIAWVVVLVIVVAGVVVAKGRLKNKASEAAATVSAPSAPGGDPLAAANRLNGEPKSRGTAGKPSVEPLPGSKFDEVLRNGKPTMADFGAGWCDACKKMVPVLADAAAKYQGKANIVFADTDTYPVLAKHYTISLIPTQIFFDAKGKEISRHVGYMKPEEVAAQLAAAGAK